MRVLIVEDESSAQHLLRRDVEAIDRAEITTASSLADVEALAGTGFDVAVLDLALPDGWGLDSLLSFRRLIPDVPVVVVSGTQGAAFAEKAARAGAIAFLEKSELRPGDLAITLREIEAGDAQPATSDTVAELARLAQFRMGTSSPATARAMGILPLAEAAPERFGALVGQYADLVELLVEQQMFGADYRGSTHLRDLGYGLGAIGAGPRDVVAIHAAALEGLTERRQTATAYNFAEESRFVVLELMGYLAAYYRVQAVGSSGIDMGKEATS